MYQEESGFYEWRGQYVYALMQVALEKEANVGDDAVARADKG